MLEIQHTPPHDLPERQRIGTLLKVMNRHLFEKEKLIRLALLSSLAGESIFLLGPPGVAKSMVATRLKFAFSGARAFEFLMGKFSTPDEVFGPISISKLKNEDKYERLVDNYLPGAQIVFLDEIWKASPAIQNALLSVINEKIFRNGDQIIKVDLRGLIAASNELPKEGEGLEAIWDRFLVRLLVGGIEEEESFNQMVTLPMIQGNQDLVPFSLKVKDDEYKQWEKEIERVLVPEHILGCINHVRRSVKERNITTEEKDQIYISDRRWRKIIRLLRTSAFFNGRDEVYLMDCFLLEDCIWNKPTQIEEVRAIVLGSITAYGYKKMLRLASLKEEREYLKEWIIKETRKVKLERVERIKQYKDRNDQYFVKIFQFWTNNAAFALLEDIKSLEPEKDTFIKVFELSGNTFRPYQTHAFKRQSPFTLYSKKRNYQLETEDVDKEVVQQIVPSDDLIRQWNAQINIMLTTCDEVLSKLERRRESDIADGKENLFVNHMHAVHIERSIDASIQEMLQMRLDIEKISHEYEFDRQS